MARDLVRVASAVLVLVGIAFVIDHPALCIGAFAIIVLFVALGTAMAPTPRRKSRKRR